MTSGNNSAKNVASWPLNPNSAKMIFLMISASTSHAAIERAANWTAAGLAKRAAIILKEYPGMTFQEIADLLGCPLSTVKTRLYQGLSVLRRNLEQNGRRITPALVSKL